jgi:hypothetical protein
VSFSLITIHLENKNEEEESQPSKQEHKKTQMILSCIECEGVNAWMVGVEVVVGYL